MVFLAPTFWFSAISTVKHKQDKRSGVPGTDLLVLCHESADELDVVHQTVVLPVVGLQVLQPHVQQFL